MYLSLPEDQEEESKSSIRGILRLRMVSCWDCPLRRIEILQRAIGLALRGRPLRREVAATAMQTQCSYGFGELLE